MTETLSSHFKFSSLEKRIEMVKPIENEVNRNVFVNNL